MIIDTELTPIGSGGRSIIILSALVGGYMCLLRFKQGGY